MVFFYFYHLIANILLFIFVIMISIPSIVFGSISTLAQSSVRYYLVDTEIFFETLGKRFRRFA